ncbi:Urease accessory protein UreH [compost metagenome]
MINQLNLISGYKDGRSYLKDAFFTRPFRLANIGSFTTDHSLQLMIMSSSPGILDGDRYDISIQVEEQSRLLLESQSYQRLFNMQHGAEQKMTIALAPGAVFSFVQHPVVPHEQSIFKAHNTIQLSDNCQFTFGEIITCGRKHSGEVFRFSRLHNLTEIFHNGKLVLKDNILLQPQLMAMNTLGQTEGYSHQATFIYIDTAATEDSIEHIITGTYDYLQEEEGIDFGISQPFSSCMIIRVLGNGGEQLYDAFRHIQRKLWTVPETEELPVVVPDIAHQVQS